MAALSAGSTRPIANAHPGVWSSELSPNSQISFFFSTPKQQAPVLVEVSRQNCRKPARLYTRRSCVDHVHEPSSLSPATVLIKKRPAVIATPSAAPVPNQPGGLRPRWARLPRRGGWEIRRPEIRGLSTGTPPEPKHWPQSTPSTPKGPSGPKEAEIPTTPTLGGH